MPVCVPFWLKPSIFGFFELTRFIIDSHVFTILPSLAPHRVMLAVPPCPHGVSFTLTGMGYIVRVASDPAVTSNACTPRLLREEPQDLS